MSAPSQTPSLSLLSLPDEILVLIARKLDLEGQVNVYETCNRLRLVLTEKSVVQKLCQLGCSPLATMETFRRPFFCDLANLITELDLKLVPDLTKTKLLPVLKRMTNLTGLDVSHTKINIYDFPSISVSCPKLIKLSIELDYPNEKKEVVLLNHIQKLQSMHLVINLIKHDLNLLFRFIRLIATKQFEQMTEFKVTSIQAEASTSSFARLPLECKDLFNATIPCHVRNTQENYSMNDSEWEYIHISVNSIPKVFMSEQLYEAYRRSPLFHNWNVHKVDTPKLNLNRKFHSYMFHKTVIENEKDFYNNFLRTLENNLMNVACYRKINGVSKQSYSSNSSSSYYLGPCCLEEKQEESAESVYDIPNKRRSKCKQLKFNIDQHVHTSEKEVKIMLGPECFCRIAHSVYRIFDWTLCFDAESTQMSNITFLHLKNIGSVEATFFKLLFQKCGRLSVLNLDNEVQTLCGHNLLNSLSRATSLTNLRIREPRITSLNLYESLSKCCTLENVHIVDDLPKTDKLDNRFLLEFVTKCVRLYCFFLYLNCACFTSLGKAQTNLLKKAAALVKHKALHVNVIELEKNYRHRGIPCNAYTEVFFLNTVYLKVV